MGDRTSGEWGGGQDFRGGEKEGHLEFRGGARPPEDCSVE